MGIMVPAGSSWVGGGLFNTDVQRNHFMVGGGPSHTAGDTPLILQSYDISYNRWYTSNTIIL